MDKSPYCGVITLLAASLLAGCATPEKSDYAFELPIEINSPAFDIASLTPINQLPSEISPRLMLKETQLKAKGDPLRRQSITRKNDTTAYAKKILLKNTRKSTLDKPQFVVFNGQTYLVAMRQWLTKNKIQNVAWSLSPEVMSVLNTPLLKGRAFDGNIAAAIKQIGITLNIPLRFSQNQRGLAAIHTLTGNVDINWVDGASLQDAVGKLVRDFGWRWQDDDWRAFDDFGLAAPYTIVSPRGDVAFALNQVIDGYNIKASLDYGIKRAFIQEK